MSQTQQPMAPSFTGVNASGVPAEAFTLNGRCKCGAVAFSITAPADSARPKFQGDLTSPLVTTDHCNDCRRATGAIIPTWIVVPLDMASFTLRVKLPRRASVESAASAAESEGLLRPHVHSCADADALAALPKRHLASTDTLLPSAATADTYLGYYETREGTWRYFCTSCGSQFAYHMDKVSEGWNKSVEILIGSLDREDMERIRVSRELWCGLGLKWVRKWSKDGSGDVERWEDYRQGFPAKDFDD